LAVPVASPRHWLSLQHSCGGPTRAKLDLSAQPSDPSPWLQPPAREAGPRLNRASVRGGASPPRPIRRPTATDWHRQRGESPQRRVKNQRPLPISVNGFRMEGLDRVREHLQVKAMPTEP
jgi:hypothetical protein